MTSLDDVCEDVRRISAACPLPLLVDADTGWGGASTSRAPAASWPAPAPPGCTSRTRSAAKRCGHRPGKALVPPAEMVDRVKAAVDGRADASFVVMARTDAHAVEGQAAAIDARAGLRRRRRRHDLRRGAADPGRVPPVHCSAVPVPVLANITEFGKTPLFTVAELAAAGVRLVLYPLSASRAAAKAQVAVYAAIRKDGTQKNVVPCMQTRAELYDVLGYHAYEQKLDELFGKDSHD